MEPSWLEQYSKLGEYMAVRASELGDMFSPYIEVTDKYGAFMCGVVEQLGQTHPSSEQDEVVRDLIADVFNTLYNARRLIVESQLTVAYPLLRRAYESQSLLVACLIDSDISRKWMKGKKIQNVDVRKVLDSHPLGESGERLRELYRFLSEAAHPSRSLVPFRYLGQGNSFVLGAIGVPDLVFVADYCENHLSLWFWFGASVSFNYRRLLNGSSGDFQGAYSAIAKSALEVLSLLSTERSRLLAEEKDR